MGICFSYHVSFGRKVHDVEYASDNRNDSACRYGDCKARVMLSGSSKFVSMYCEKGKKEENQDALTAWEDFTGEKDMIFCGVFDGHGPLGHKYAQIIRDNLPSKLSAAIKMSEQNVYSEIEVHGEKNQNMPFASWEGSFVKSFSEMDEYLAQNIDTNGFCGGSTAVTVVKQGDQLIIGNLGDSRVVLCTRGDGNCRIPIQLTVDLKPNIASEASRIINCGGRVFATAEDPGVDKIWMPKEDCPGLAMSRAFGDFCLKDHGLTPIPDVIYRRIDKQDEFVVLATDGVWDVLTNNEVINIVASAPKRSKAAKMLVKHAVRAWRYKCPSSTIDDCTVICLFLNN